MSYTKMHLLNTPANEPKKQCLYCGGTTSIQPYRHEYYSPSNGTIEVVDEPMLQCDDLACVERQERLTAKEIA